MIELGTKVTWRSQANASYKTKAGTVVIVVPAGKHVQNFVRNTNWDISALVPFSLTTRKHESYLVAVYGNSRRGKLYWPRVSQLKEQ